jgi:hypothetical protein
MRRYTFAQSTSREGTVAHLSKAWFLAAILLFSTLFARPARAAGDPPSDLCSLLTVTQINTITGAKYDAPKKTVAPAPFMNTASGTDCTYTKSNDSRERTILFRAYVDPSPAAASDLFAKLGAFFGTGTPITGLGDKAYIDNNHGLHVLKGKVRFFIAMGEYDQKQVVALANYVIGQL